MDRRGGKPLKASGATLSTRSTSTPKHEPAGDIDAAAMDSLKALDPERPIREADIDRFSPSATFVQNVVEEQLDPSFSDVSVSAGARVLRY